ncbi:hypothetical protein SAMN05444362_107162 [Dysgonomonas macrotermitis]|uniref:Secreted protein n=1 Tax=Dysgonomonas macrotermitis TaxID=1346286 RepID=A0A1M5CGJ3_9BACT|nr:hypothetical protein SAMN05444362_107162 [Dysgonomonas macrotermitis]
MRMLACASLSLSLSLSLSNISAHNDKSKLLKFRQLMEFLYVKIFIVINSMNILIRDANIKISFLLCNKMKQRHFSLIELGRYFYKGLFS